MNELYLSGNIIISLLPKFGKQMISDLEYRIIHLYVPTTYLQLFSSSNTVCLLALLAADGTRQGHFFLLFISKDLRIFQIAFFVPGSFFKKTIIIMLASNYRTEFQIRFISNLERGRQSLSCFGGHLQPLSLTVVMTADTDLAAVPLVLNTTDLNCVSVLEELR